MADHPEVSVIIPAHNAASVIGTQLNALRTQVDAPRFEVLVCDNNSTDGTAAAARAAGQGLDLRVIDASGPASASFARNRGAEEARGEVLAFTDSDDLVVPGWMRTLADAVRSQDPVLVTGSLEHARFNDAEVLAAYRIPPDPPLPLPGEPIATPSPFAGYLPTIAGPSFGIRKRDYLAVGGMDPVFPGGSEETDFAWRAQQAGIPVISAPSAIAHYRLRDAPRGIYRQQRIQQRARIFLWTRYRGTSMTGPSWKYSLTHLVRDLVASARPRRSRAERLRTAHDLGGSVGAIEGMLKYRLLRRRQD